jgi:hypothetical protein
MTDNARSKPDPYWPRGLSRVQAAHSLPSPPDDFGFNQVIGPGAAPCPVNPKTGEREHVGAFVIFTKQFHPVTGRGLTI